jgi:hypothetical protein
MSKVNVTYESIINDFEEACNQHYQVSSFDNGTLDYLDASAVNRLYPFVYMRPISAVLTERTRTLTFELYSLDQPKNQSQSNTSVISDTEMTIYDLMAWFNYGPAERQQWYEVNLVSASPVNEAFQDRVFGWVATIEVITPFNLDYCNYPQP